jgi:hypothetical protein
MVKRRDDATERKQGRTMASLNVTMLDPTKISLATLRAADIRKVPSEYIRRGIAAIDDHGFWRATLDQPKTKDEQKRAILCEELVRRGEKAPK